MKARAAKKIESVGPGGCACLCKSCDDQRHCHRPETGCRANEREPQQHARKRRGTKKAVGKSRPTSKRERHPKGCDYPRYAGKVKEDDRIYQTFHKTAKLLGEVEAGLDAYFRLAKAHGLFAAPADGTATICERHAKDIMADAQRLTALLSTEAKLVIPVLFMLVGDQKAATILGVELPEREAEEMIH